MRRNLIILILLVLIVISLVLILNTNKSSSEDYIRNEIDKANYCISKEDCVLAGSKCPFGCNIFVNKDEEERISNLVENYQTNCMYACVQLKDYDCVDSKCEVVY